MYEDRVLAFMDFLGFSETIKRTMSNGLENEDETIKIDRLFEDARNNLIKQNLSYNDNLREGKIANHFSDSIVISYPKTKAGGIFYLIAEILFFSLTALQEGFLLRGTIVCGKLYHTETKIFGPALVKAYETEHTIAIYPRIILDDNILDIAKEYPREMKKAKTEFKTIQNLLLKDFDGYSFVNYLDIAKTKILTPDDIQNYFEPVRTTMQKIEQNEDPGIKSKYLWLKGHYKTIFSKYKRRFYNDKTKKAYPALYNYIESILKEDTGNIR